MDILQAMRVFSTVADSGSFAKAADRLGLSRASVTRQVAQLEDHLGSRLLNRTTRRLSLTEAGSLYLQRCQEVLELIDDAERLVGGQHSVPVGTLRVSAPVSFGSRYLAPALAAYVDRYPAVAVELELNDRQVNLVEEGFDIAIRIADRLDPGLVARRLALARLRLCAAPAYLARRGVPQAPAELHDHNCLVYTYASSNVWVFRQASQTERIAVAGSIRANNGDALLTAAATGLGIILQPDFIVAEAVGDGRLVVLFDDYDCGEAGIYAVYPSRRYLPLKVRSFIDFLAGQPPWPPAGVQSVGRLSRP